MHTTIEMFSVKYNTRILGLVCL